MSSKKSKTKLSSKKADESSREEKQLKDTKEKKASRKQIDDGLSLEKTKKSNTIRKRPREDPKQSDTITKLSLKKESSGISEIDDLFADKKQKAIEKEKKEEQERICKKAKMQKSSSSKKANTKNVSLKYDRSDVANLNSKDWVNDGLGGIFNKDGYTGRREETSGYKVYKAHLFNKKGFGDTPDCPFDCDCCFI